MQKIKQISLTAIAIVALITAGTSSVALARDGGSGDDSSSSGSGSSNPTQLQQQLQDKQGRSGSSKINQNTTAPVRPASSDDNNEHSQANTVSELRQKADDELAEKKKQHKEKSHEERQKTCEERKKGIETKFNRISTNGQKFQTRIDGILDKATAYADKNNLNNGNIADLITAANAAKSKSAASVTNLQTLKPTIDCTSNTVPSDIATFKAAAKDARDNLKSYRTAVKNLLKALIDATKTSNPTGSSGDNSTTQGGAQ